MDTLIDEHLRHGEEKNFLVPVYEGKKGHPPSDSKGVHRGNMLLGGGKGDLRGITDRYYERMKRIPVEDEGCLLDMDTPEGYREIKDFLEGGRKAGGACGAGGGKTYIPNKTRGNQTAPGKDISGTV